MKQFNIIIILFFILNSFFSTAEAIDKKVLFIGNSYTYVNNLPLLVKNLAEANGHNLTSDQSTIGAANLATHASNATTTAKINSQDWDCVILQAQSQEPSWPISQINTEVYPYATTLCNSIRNNNACSEIIFYMTWGRKNGDAGNCPSWPPVCTFEGMNQRLLVSYYNMKESNEASLSPIGLAWKLVRNDPNAPAGMDLYSSDNSHPSIYGSYLTACVLYHNIYKEDLNNNSFHSSLSETQAIYLQEIANSLFTDSYEYSLNDSITDAEYSFTNQSWYETQLSIDSIETCVPYTWINGITYTESNYTATHTLSNAQGCDSLIHLFLTIENKNRTDSINSCGPYTWIDGNTYTESNHTATHSIPNEIGCDSTIYLFLNITIIAGDLNHNCTIDGEEVAGDSNGNGIIDNGEVCGDLNGNGIIDGNEVAGDQNGNKIIDNDEQSGDANNNGTGYDCEDFGLLHIDINYSILKIGEILMAVENKPNILYQWINCADSSLITGATQRTYQPNESGNYAVIIRLNNCSDTSECIVFSATDIVQKEASSCLIYPNPAKGQIHLNLKKISQNTQIGIFNSIGQRIKTVSARSETLSIDVQGLKQGTYWILIEDNGRKEWHSIIIQ